MKAIPAILRYMLVLAVLTAGLVLLMDQLVMPLYIQAGKVRYLPNVVGMSLNQATSRLALEGFPVEQAGLFYTQEYPPGQVYEMFPAAYAQVKPGRIIQLTLTAEEKLVSVPQLTGISIRAAEIEIAKAGLVIDTIMYDYSEESRTNVVTWQSPKEGNLLRRGSGLTLLVSLGEAPEVYYVPNVVGLSFHQGRREILNAGLEIGSVRRVFAPKQLPNTILNQSIPGGTALALKRFVNLTVSSYEDESP